MEVESVSLDKETSLPFVRLREKNGDKTMPIWIGLLEASAIATELEGVRLTRPLTHDLILSMLVEMDSNVEKVEINNLKDNVYYASIFIKQGDSIIEVDSRPSDAIAISLKAGIDIFVEEDIIKEAQTLTPHSSDVKLEDIPVEGYGKYKM